MSDEPADIGKYARPHAALSRIANALDTPLQAFFDGRADANLDRDKLELLRLWDATPQGPRRQRILALARQEADQAQNMLKAAE